MAGAPYYAKAFSPLPGRCFRLVARPGEGGPTHCPEPVALARIVAGTEQPPLPGRGL